MKSVILAEDDLVIDDLVTIYSLKNHPNRAIDIMGCPLRIAAICFPFVVCKMLAAPEPVAWTLDCRRVNFMRITPEYVQAVQCNLAVPKDDNATHSRIPEDQDAGQPE